MSDGWAANPQLPQELLRTLLHDLQAASANAPAATLLGMAACLSVLLQAVQARLDTATVNGAVCFFPLFEFHVLHDDTGMFTVWRGGYETRGQ